ncbi:MAG: ABC transporter ATP-binding protein [Chloroflexi bacterium]|nr:ABC transporter ATP-binding protein [Chloroflexota bacterium]
MNSNLAIETQDLGRIYKIRDAKKKDRKELVALHDVNLAVERGELFGLLGPNGAGKTTLIKILTTLLAPTLGWARVASFDVMKQQAQVRPLINMVSGGESSGYGLLTVRENLWMFSQFYGIPTAQANQRIKELLDVVGMSDRLNTKSADLSTGLRQKMNIVRGFLTDPHVVFLDEPTLGLDVGASRDVRAFVRRWVKENPERTVMLTTHYMVEADELCDRVAIINQGRVLACDTPSNLKRRLQREAIFRVETNRVNGTASRVFESLPGVKNVIHRPGDARDIIEFVLEQEHVLGSVFNAMESNHIQLLHLEKREPTLEDVFVDLVGRSMEQVEHAEPS